MGARYSTLSASGYNSSAPADDGSQVAANLVTWAGVKTKLGDPVKTLADAINTALVTAFDYTVRQISASDSTVAGDHMRTVEIAPTVSAAVTVSLMDAATATSGYLVRVRNSSTIAQTVSRVTGGDTIDGVAGTVTIQSKETRTFLVIGAATGYITLSIGSTTNLSLPGTLAVTGTITPSQTNGIVGTTTNNNANALSVGEYVSGTLAVGSATSLSTGTAKTIISISLTAGDWDVAATGYILPAAGTQVASVASSISQTNNTLDTANGSIVVNALGNMVVATFSTEHGVPVVPVRISLAGTTTIYLVMSATFSVSTMTAYGNIRARRVR